MMRDFFILIVAISMVILAPAVANSPADALGASVNASTKIPNATIINPMDPGYVWGNPQAVVLSGTNPVVFLNSAFSAEVGGLASGPSFTSSINRFRSDDPNAGVSNATKKAAKVGLTHWP